MKKVVLSAMALMIGTLAFAQVSTDPSAPAVTKATNLSPDPLANAVENNQSGVENYQLVRQEGTSSSVYIDQSGGGTGLGNLIYVRQTGNVNGNQALSGQENSADVRQAGTENEAFVRQEGDRNEAAMRQEASVSESIGYIRQGTGQNAEDNYAGIVQENGTDNSAWIQQTYDDSEALTLQNGSNHRALTKQNANPNASPGHNARVEQNGDGQMSYVDQEGSNANADVLQNGNGNYSDVQQSDGGPVLATNSADVDQNGTGNKSFINQSDKDNASVVDQDGTLNKAHVIQSGVGANAANVTQLGDTNYARQEQTNGAAGSASNIALINQGDVSSFGTLTNAQALYNETNAVLSTIGTLQADGTRDNVAFQTQEGSGNLAESMQFADPTFGAPFSGYTKQIQIGNDNTAVVAQNTYEEPGTFNDNNSALQVQTGDNNIAGLIQSGNSHDAWMIQDGDDKALAVQSGIANDLVTKQWEGANFMEIGQQGTLNAVYAAQRGGQSFIGDQAGSNNVMEVLQVGPDMDPWETIDCDIPAEMQPMPLPGMQGLDIPEIDVPELCTDC